MKRLEAKEVHQLIDQSEQYYLASGFHVSQHRQDVLDASQELSALALSQGVYVDGQVVVLASNWHDAGLAFNPIDFLIRTKNGVRPANSSEEIAVELFTSAAKRIGAPKKLISDVNKAIASTHPLVKPKTTEAKVVAAGDVHGVGFNTYPKFVAGTHALWEEAKWRQGREIDWSEFAKGSIRYLALFMARDIQLTPNYYDELGRSAWHVGAINNVMALAKEAWGQQVPVNGVWSEQNVFRLNIGDKEPAEINLPVSNNILPIPSELLDGFKLSESMARLPGAAKEVGRVLNSSGILEYGL
jgi:hypothetical protein